MNIEYLSEYCYLAKVFSFTKTAEHFFTSRSVISRHMAALEEELGVKLLERDRHNVSITEQGKLFYKEAQILLRDYVNMMSVMQHASINPSSLIRIGYLRNASRPFIIEFLDFMQSKYPDLRLVPTCMDYSELCRALEEDKVDVAFSMDIPSSISNVHVSVPIYSDRFYVIAASGHPLASHREGIMLSDLAREKLLLPDSFSYAGMSDFIEGIFNKRPDLYPAGYYRNLDTMRIKVQVENCVALESGFELDYNKTIYNDNMVALPVLDADMSFSVSAFYHSDLDSYLVKACRDGFSYCSKLLMDRMHH